MNWAATSPSDRLADAIVVSGWSAIEQAESPLEFYYRPADRFVSGFTDPPKTVFIPAASASGTIGNIRA
jgi:ABC-type sugar transport system ATPase subunit